MDSSEDCPIQTALRTPEVLDMIFSWIDFEDLRNCRLVNSEWRNGATIQMNERAHLNLKIDRVGKNKKPTLARKIASVRFEDFRKFTLVWNFPTSFEAKVGTNLKVLHLRDVRFGHLDELRRVIFKSFPKLTELGLIDVLVPELAPQLKQINPDRIPKVEKVVIKRTLCSYDGRRGKDVFDLWGFKEILERFAPSLKALEANQGVRAREGSFKIFEELLSSKIKLINLKYFFSSTQECIAFKMYLEQCGECLLSLTVERGSVLSQVLFNQVFERAPISQYQYMSIFEQDWSQWRGGDFSGMKRISVQCHRLQSFRFLTKMPNLEIVKFSSFYEIPSDFVSHQGNAVHTLGLEFFSLENVCRVAKVFPAVRRLILGACSFVNVEVDILKEVAKAWPNLEELEMDGFVRPCLQFEDETTPGRYNRDGYPKFADLCQLLQLKSLKVFIFRHSMHNNMWFGNDTAEKVFLKMENLKRLHLMCCSMSADVITKLEGKLVLFTFSNRQTLG